MTATKNATANVKACVATKVKQAAKKYKKQALHPMQESAMKGSWVWYEANGLCEVQDIETMSEILNPHRLNDVKRQLLFEGETVEMAAEPEGVTVEWMNAWIEEQYQFKVKSALGWVRQWVAY